MIEELRELLAPRVVLDADKALSAVTGAAIVVLEEWTPGQATALAEHAHRHDVLHLPVRCDGALGLVGPVQYRGATGCLNCAETRRLMTLSSRTLLHQPLSRDPGLRFAGTLSPALLDGVAALADAVLADPDANQSTVWTFHGGRATWTTHQVQPLGGCAVCQPLPADSPGNAAIDLSPQPLPDPCVLRRPNPRLVIADLRADLHDPVFGPVYQVLRTEDSPLSSTSALISRGVPVREGGYGRSPDFDSSERVALLEAVERYRAARPGGRATSLRASFAQLGDERAVDPARLGLPEPAYDGHRMSATVPYTPDLELDWVYGWSLTRDRAIAVPEHVAYWDAPHGPRVVYECSNGCSLGGSPQEAALYGLFEVAERDAFLMAWYTRTPLPRVRTARPDPVVEQLADRAALLGYAVTVLDATNDFAIPAVVAVARYQGTESAAPQAFIAAGAHHDPRAAVRAAVAELVTNVHLVTRRAAAEPQSRDLDRLYRMLREPERIVSLEDHVGVNTLPEAAPRVDALLGAAFEVELPEPEPVADLTALLTDTVRRLGGQGLEVVVVGLDGPGTGDRFGLSCVKVIVPGSLPMTFGYVNRRTRGLPRLLEVPCRLGRVEQPLRYEDLPFDPHPFP
ncbi:MAG TPA: TOMM precursor leader peptide-binding protein [Actinocrinis sp.]|jgi:ribosomal protein S12 methylthiotransferase accessory factor|uniref:TOMM precursor leader peptide-binding protein n=1 Tax=Actinocrinis sp. TaxID=1920516 RepID=UPI002DDCEED8|nr:TOMM precursor leader peptide-binding protein [Actinocrinis sp.]HEV3171676.1 TOMM precursor leader peptide-binding protein [Actinocrinis sp.]